MKFPSPISRQTVHLRIGTYLGGKPVYQDLYKDKVLTFSRAA